MAYDGVLHHEGLIIEVLGSVPGGEHASDRAQSAEEEGVAACGFDDFVEVGLVEAVGVCFTTFGSVGRIFTVSGNSNPSVPGVTPYSSLVW